MPNRRPRVLLVETDDDLAAAIAQTLEPRYAVECHLSVDEAVPALQSFEPDVVVVNVTNENVVPEVGSRVPLVVITARTLEEFPHTEAVPVLRLPFDAEDLLGAVERVIEP